MYLYLIIIIKFFKIYFPVPVFLFIVIKYFAANFKEKKLNFLKAEFRNIKNEFRKSITITLFTVYLLVLKINFHVPKSVQFSTLFIISNEIYIMNTCKK